MGANGLVTRYRVRNQISIDPQAVIIAVRSLSDTENVLHIRSTADIADLSRGAKLCDAA
jgi:hypothetical protein